MGNDKEYRLKIRKDGMVKYYCEDGYWWSLKYNKTAKPHHFEGRIQAQDAYLAWAHKFPVTASDWIPEIEEV